MPGALHNRPAQGGFTSHEESNANQALIADNCDFRRSAVRQHVKERDNGAGRKVNVRLRIAGLIQRTFGSQRKKAGLPAVRRPHSRWVHQRQLKH